MNTPENFTYPKADFGKRLIALIIDILIIVAIVFLLFYMGFYIADIMRPSQYLGLLMVWAGAILSIYYLLFKDSHLKGQSYGKRYMGLIVIDCETNKPCNKTQSAIRQLIFLVLSLIECIITLLQGEGRRLGDFVAKTQVIELSLYEKEKYTQN